MSLDLGPETLWQQESNSCWFTNIQPVCDLCGKKVERVAEIKVQEEDDATRACFISLDNRNCFQQAMNMFYAQNPDVDLLLVRSVEYKPIGKHAKNSTKRKREAIGLSKRYNILNRDGFQCVLCGASGKEAKLEIDHIIPVAEGGTEAMGNLQTLCFFCNRGKGAKTE